MIITKSQSVCEVAVFGKFEELLRNLIDETEKHHDKGNLL